MANTDKDILITPNNGSSSADPKIEFKGADASTSAQTITATAYPTNNGTLSFDGSAGQLFSITNDMTGTIFSVNDVSGIPSIEVDDDGTIRFAEYSGNVLIGTATDDGSKLQVNGSATVSSNFTASNVYVAGSLIHEGDTDTYINFQNNLIYFTAGNNSTLAVAGTYAQFTAPLYNYSVYYEDYDALSGTSVTVNCDTAQAFSLTMTGNTTFTFNSVSSAWATGFVLELTGNGGTVTWPTSVDWAGGTAPDAPASGETDIYAFWTRDGGTTWYGVLSVDAAA